jgi:hypothetical protein
MEHKVNKVKAYSRSLVLEREEERGRRLEIQARRRPEPGARSEIQARVTGITLLSMA